MDGGAVKNFLTFYSVLGMYCAPPVVEYTKKLVAVGCPVSDVILTDHDIYKMEAPGISPYTPGSKVSYSYLVADAVVVKP
jgi:hypothetical protein